MITDMKDGEPTAYYSTMYLDGYTPEQILMAKRAEMFEDYLTKDPYITALKGLMKNITKEIK